MHDVSERLKALVIARLDASPEVTSLVAPTSIFPMQPKALPPLPFIRFSFVTIEPHEDSCGQGITSSFDLHCFAAGDEGGLAGETQTQRIAAAIALAVPGLEGVDECVWLRTNFMSTDEADTWHGVISFRATLKQI